jgi:hypothetical protein
MHASVAKKRTPVRRRRSAMSSECCTTNVRSP